MSNEAARPGNDSLKDYRGAEPAKDDDAAPSAPVADDDGALPPPIAEMRGPEQAKPDKPEEPEAPPEAPKLTPFDQKRAAIAERFAPKRLGETTDTDLDMSKPENVYGKLAGPPADAPETGDDAAAQPKPSPMTLAVNGKTISKTLAEVAALADMTEDEVRADPSRAKKYAQRELATTDNLERSRIARRDLPARPGDDVDTRATRPAPDQERQAAGKQDGPDQQPASRDTSDEELARLIEDIQIGDPKEVAPKLKKMFATMAQTEASGVVQSSQGNQRRQEEIKSGITVFKTFLDEHPEISDKPVVAAALARQMDEEYRADLRTAMINQGDTEADADAILRQASSQDIRNAHLERRINGDPHVRRIDKTMADNVWNKVQSDFGVTAASKPQTPSRQGRKEALPVQPRRASVPPATQAAEPAPLSRKSAVAEMAARTGRKPASLNR